MNHLNNFKVPVIAALLAFLLAAMLIIVKHYNSNAYYQQRIFDHSEIIDKI